MAKKSPTKEELLLEVAELRLRLIEAEETLEAIRSGAVDALVVASPQGEQVFTLKGADYTYRVLVEAMSEGAATLTPEGTILYANQRLADMLKTPLGKVIGAELAQFVAAEDEEMFEALMEQSLRRRLKGELALRTGDGKPLPVYLSATPLQMDGAQAVCMVVTDLTGQKRHEEIVAEGRLTRTILEQAGEAIVVCDPNGEVIYASSLVRDLCGANPIRRRFDDLCLLYETEEKPFPLSAVLSGGSFQGLEGTLAGEDGQVFDVLVSARPLKDEAGLVLGCVVSMMDITARKQAEKTLKEAYVKLERQAAEIQSQSEELQVQTEELQTQSEELWNKNQELERLTRNLEAEQGRLKAIISSAPEGIVVADEKARVLLTNPVAERLYGRRVPYGEEFESHASLELRYPDGSLYNPRDLPLTRAALDGEPSFDVEMAIVWPEGIRRDLLVNAAPIRDYMGRVTGAVGILQDITERKQAQQKIEALNRELYDNLRQLEAANQELEAFSYSVSHDLRTPLRAVHGFARMLADGYKASLDQEGRRLLEVIQSNAVRMGQLIDDLLALSRLGRQGLNFSMIPMEEMARAVFTEIRSFTPERHLELRLGHLPQAWGDRDLIRQVLVNLLNNAVKFTQPRDAAVIEVEGWDEKKETVYCVRDNGVGFNMEYADRLFGPFQRLHPVGQFEGTGIGLAIVQRIVRRHGGRVWAEAKLGEGATFYFAIPRKGMEFRPVAA